MRLILIMFFGWPGLLMAQYAPAGGEIGSKAIHCNSTFIKAWVNHVAITRGWKDISDTTQGKASQGNDEEASGKADGIGVSLGDGGIALISLNEPLKNGQGHDFAVYENGFKYIKGYFLELAHVEVSTDGVRFMRFRSDSETDTIIQLNNLADMDAKKINNLAGRDPAFWGTPFDISELPDVHWLNKDSIFFIRIVDVVGNINPSYANRDGLGKTINDPWPTPWENGGFDLDAVALLNEGYTSTSEIVITGNSVYPNPANTSTYVTINALEVEYIWVSDVNGKKICVSSDKNGFFAPEMPGVYQVFIQTSEGSLHTKLCVY